MITIFLSFIAFCKLFAPMITANTSLNSAITISVYQTYNCFESISMLVGTTFFTPLIIIILSIFTFIGTIYSMITCNKIFFSNKKERIILGISPVNILEVNCQIIMHKKRFSCKREIWQDWDLGKPGWTAAYTSCLILPPARKKTIPLSNKQPYACLASILQSHKLPPACNISIHPLCKIPPMNGTAFSRIDKLPPV